MVAHRVLRLGALLAGKEGTVPAYFSIDLQREWCGTYSKFLYDSGSSCDRSGLKSQHGVVTLEYYQ